MLYLEREERKYDIAKRAARSSHLYYKKAKGQLRNLRPPKKTIRTSSFVLWGGEESKGHPGRFGRRPETIILH